MGTINLTMVINEAGEKKISQYGQWDGYPSGVGVGVLSFLSDAEKVKKLKEKLPLVRFLDIEGRDKDFLDAYNSNANKAPYLGDPEHRTPEQIRWWDTYQTRDLAETILTNVADSTDSEILLMDRTDTATKGGLVEWSYVINFKENTLTIYGLIDADPVKTYSLDALPSEEDFIKELEGEDEE